MADSRTGAWFSCFVTIPRAGDVNFSFERYRRMYADGVWGDFSMPQDGSVEDPITDDEYVLDLQRFPRDDQFIPQWCAGKTTPSDSRPEDTT
jgi:hypothetical protein